MPLDEKSARIKNLKRRLGKPVEDRKNSEDVKFVTVRIPFGKIPPPEEDVFGSVRDKVGEDELTEQEMLGLMGYGMEIAREISERLDVCNKEKVISVLLSSNDTEIIENVLGNCQEELVLNGETYFNLYEWGLKNSDEIINYYAGGRIRNKASADTKCGVLKEIAQSADRSDILESILGNGDIPDKCECEILTNVGQNLSVSQMGALTILKRDMDNECKCRILIDLAERGVLTAGRIAMHGFPEDCGCDIANIFISKGEEEMVSRMNLPEDCAGDILLKLADHDDYDIRGNVASNRNIPDDVGCEIFEKLARDKTKTVKVNVAENEKIPEDCVCSVLARLARLSDDDIAKSALDNTSTPAECREDVFDSYIGDSVRRERLSRLVKVIGADREGYNVEDSEIINRAKCEKTEEYFDIRDELKKDDQYYGHGTQISYSSIPEMCRCDYMQRAVDKDDVSEIAVMLDGYQATEILKESDCGCDIIEQVLDRAEDDEEYYKGIAYTLISGWGVLRVPEECSREVLLRSLKYLAEYQPDNAEYQTTRLRGREYIINTLPDFDWDNYVENKELKNMDGEKYEEIE